jgi:hypothetical protein
MHQQIKKHKMSLDGIILHDFFIFFGSIEAHGQGDGPGRYLLKHRGDILCCGEFVESVVA